MKIIKLFLLFLPVFITSACRYYSFSGTNISPDVKTISVETITDQTGMGPTTLSQEFSEKMRDYFQRNAGLTVTKQEGDLRIEGSIVGYAVSPLAANANEVASKSRLTITVQIKFTNMFDEEQNFERSFSFFDDFDQAQDLTSVEQSLINTITNQIIIDIFNASVANW